MEGSLTNTFSVLTVREYSLKRTVERGGKDAPDASAEKAATARSSNEKTDGVMEETTATRPSTEKGPRE